MSDDATRQSTIELVSTFQTLLGEERFDDWIELWAADGVCEYPYAPPERRVFRGREEIFAYIKLTAGRVQIHSVEEMNVHPLLDPEALIVETTVVGKAVASGLPFRQSYVVVVQCRGGLVTRYREYWNPEVARFALGDVPDGRLPAIDGARP